MTYTNSMGKLASSKLLLAIFTSISFVYEYRNCIRYEKVSFVIEYH